MQYVFPTVWSGPLLIPLPLRSPPENLFGWSLPSASLPTFELNPARKILRQTAFGFVRVRAEVSHSSVSLGVSFADSVADRREQTIATHAFLRTFCNSLSFVVVGSFPLFLFSCTTTLPHTPTRKALRLLGPVLTGRERTGLSFTSSPLVTTFF